MDHYLNRTVGHNLNRKVPAMGNQCNVQRTETENMDVQPMVHYMDMTG